MQIDSTNKSSVPRWSELNMLVLDRRAFRLQVRYLSHWDEIRISKKYHNLLQFPSVLLGGVATTTAFTTMQENTENWSVYTVAALSAGMTILASLTSYYKFNELAEQHKDAALLYEGLLNEIGAIKRRGPTDDIDFADLVLKLDNQYLKIKTNAPLLSEKLIKKHSTQEESLFNSIHCRANPQDIESAINDDVNNFETRAIQAEDKIKTMDNEITLLKTCLNSKTISSITFNILETVCSKISKFKILFLLENWKKNASICVMLSGNKINILTDKLEQYEIMLKKEKNIRKDEKDIYEKELESFKHELSLAANEGVMKGLECSEEKVEQECLRDDVDVLVAENIALNELLNKKDIEIKHLKEIVCVKEKEIKNLTHNN